MLLPKINNISRYKIVDDNPMLSNSFQPNTEMMRLGIAPCPYFQVSDIETRRADKSYSIDTARELQQRYPREPRWSVFDFANALDLIGKDYGPCGFRKKPRKDLDGRSKDYRELYESQYRLRNISP